MRHIIPVLFLYLSTISLNTFAQSPVTDSTGTVYYKVDVPPEFPGGDNRLVKYLKKNFQYPQEALESGIEGTVTVLFTINGEGGIENVSTISPKLGGHLEMEAIRLVRSMPKWKPAMKNGKGVPAQCNIPIEFSLKEYYSNKKKKVYPMF